MSSVLYRSVVKNFGALNVLRSLDLAVPDHKFLALLGPSGCGKTTALRILAGLDMPTAGKVFIGERDVTRLQPRDRDIAMVFQSYALYPNMTVAGNIAFGMEMRGVPAAERQAAIDKVAKILQI
ncbi:MAG: ABC transporter ATP-binding protein, partial [Mesorhizobium sp.]